MQHETPIQQEFERARTRAVAATDEYFARAQDDPFRAVLWRDVASETEHARSLLERWLIEPDETLETRAKVPVRGRA